MRRLLTIITLFAGLFSAVPAAAVEPFGVERQTTDVFGFEDAPDLIDTGDATLRRTDTGVATSIEISGLEPGNVLTTWWVVWNTPEGCHLPYACGEDDLTNPDAGLAIGYASGSRVGADGIYRYDAMLAEGSALTGFPYPEFMAVGIELTEATLADSRHAEIHLVVRDHGPVVDGLAAQMVRTFNGGCEYDGPIAAAAPTYGPAGPNVCTDAYFTIFPATG